MAKYYNGIELPALPEYDKSLYPYAFIVHDISPISGEYYFLYLTNYKAKYEINYQYPGISTGIISGYALYISAVSEILRGLRYRCAPNGTEWELVNTYTDNQVSDGMYISGDGTEHDFCKWTNFDIYYTGSEENGDLANTLYLAASDPVPVGGEPTLTESDFYRVINGAWVKCDTVRKMGNEWVTQDEYRYE